MSAKPVPSTISGEEYIANLARFIRNHSEQLSASASTRRGAGHHDVRSSWTSMIYLSSQAPKPVTLTLDLYHLYYVLLKVQEAGFADVGDLDEPLRVEDHRRPALPAASLARDPDKSDTLSIKTSFSTISKGLSSIGSGWWGASTSATAADSATVLARNLKLIYTAFTLLPSLRLVGQHAKGKGKAIEGFDFPDLPGDRMLPLKSFKSLERLELEGIDARVILLSHEWDNLVHLRINNCGLESIAEILSACRKQKDNDLNWSAQLRIVNLDCNDITSIDSEETKGLDRVLSLSLRHNLLLSVPTALASMTSLRALDLSDNMIESVLAAYSSLPGLQVLVLRGNRISSLCGLERLLSLEKLDVRDNHISDASEIVRLVTLPHLTDLWVAEGNPFMNDVTSHRGYSWRMNFFQAFLRMSDAAGGRDISELPRVDGAAPSWKEVRDLSSVHKYDKSDHKQTPTVRDVATWPRDALPPSEASADSRVKTLRSRRSKNLSESAARSTGRKSPPPPVPSVQAGQDATRPECPDELLVGAGATHIHSVSPKAIGRKHRRVIDLDMVSNTAPRKSQAVARSQQRPQTPSAGAPDSAGPSSSASVPKGRHGTLPNIALTRGSQAHNRPLAPDTFLDPEFVSVQGTQPDSESEAEDFRRKMERLRNEVGATNWLAVYANTVQARQAEGKEGKEDHVHVQYSP